MFDILFARSFTIIGGMLLITAFAASRNKLFETRKEMWITIISTFAFLYAILSFSDFFPINIILVSIFSALIGWQIGPTIQLYRKRFMLKQYLKSRGIKIEKGKVDPEHIADFEKFLISSPDKHEWGKIISETLLATATAIFAAAIIVFVSDINFNFLNSFLFIALLALIFLGAANALIFRSPIFSMIKSYFGAIIFTLYLLYDFNRLESLARDTTWGTAIDISVNIYLDIINLFIYLLDILAD